MATSLQRSLMARAALLFLIGLLTGVWVGAVLTGGRAVFAHLPPPVHERLALAAHLNAILGCFWLLGVAFTIEHTRFGDRGKAWLARAATFASYANWAITLVASVLDVRGLEFTGERANDVIAVLLLGGVVFPSFGAGVLWVYGLMGKGEGP